MSEIREPVADEERNPFPMPRASRAPEQLDRLGDQVRQAKRTAPTRPPRTSRRRRAPERRTGSGAR